MIFISFFWVLTIGIDFDIGQKTNRDHSKRHDELYGFVVFVSVNMVCSECYKKKSSYGVLMVHLYCSNMLGTCIPWWLSPVVDYKTIIILWLSALWYKLKFGLFILLNCLINSQLKRLHFCLMFWFTLTNWHAYSNDCSIQKSSVQSLWASSHS